MAETQLAGRSTTTPKEPRSTALSIEDEAIIIAFRRHTLLPLDDCLYALQPTIPHLTRSSLRRCLQRHGISQLQNVDGEKRLEEEVQGLTELERRYAEAVIGPRGGKSLRVHACRLEHRLHLMPLGDQDGGGIDLGRVKKDGLV